MKRISAPRPGIVLKLVLVSAILVAIPVLAHRYFGVAQEFVLEGQRNALELAAEAVATVLHDRADLFQLEAASPLALADCSPAPLAAPILLDGNSRDWSDMEERLCRFFRVDVSGVEDPPRDPSALRTERLELRSDLTEPQPYETQLPPARMDVLELALGEYGEHLYGLFRVEDDAVRFRHPRYRSLERADHLRLLLPGSDGALRRYVVTAERAGPVSAYAVDENWRYALPPGRPIREIRGIWAEKAGGFEVELRIPRAWLRGRKLGFQVVDVDETAGEITGVTGPLPGRAPGAVELVDLPPPDLQQVLNGFSLAAARITVLDRDGVVYERADQATRMVEAEERARLIRGALAHDGRGSARLVHSGAHVTAASVPILVDGVVKGAVLIEQPNSDVLGLERDELERALGQVVIACIAVAAVLWLFAWRLAWRIHRLRDAANAAIDDDGRVSGVGIAAERNAGDEIGDLSRTISGLLGRLTRYTGFLEQFPRTLRHEISNPLNTLSTSIQNLAADHPELENNKYVQSAERGVARIGEIVEGLTDAASLEESLRDDELGLVDLADLVKRYVENHSAACPMRRFSSTVGTRPLFVAALGFRLEQLLDKLIDNAVAFSPVGGVVEVAVVPDDDRVELRVGNEGAGIPVGMRARIFDSMVSERPARVGDEVHLGIGLYVVRMIAEHMGGSVDVRDRDGGGAVIVVALPLANTTHVGTAGSAEAR